MSSLPSTSEVAGDHLALYETYYNAVDPNNHGRVEAMDAAKFLKKSNLSDIILSKIWDISDPNSRGFLDKSGMFIALKLCALAQQGHNLSISNIYMDISPPKMGDTANMFKITPCPQSSSSSNANNWSINPWERAKYEKLFQSLEPIDGYLPGNKVKGVLMDSKLPLKALGKIWDLADIDKDGQLNQHEFVVAMHLVYKALEKNAVPDVLPVELIAIDSINSAEYNSKIQSSEPNSSESMFVNAPTTVSKGAGANEWVVSNEELKSSDKLFAQADEDLDGFVSGSEIKNVFIQSGLSQIILADIWSLCDISQSGKLNNEQFALAMWLIKQKLNGMDLPSKLTSKMIPPSFKKHNAEHIIENNNVCTYSNPELDMINKHITEITHEKQTLEQDISQKEADIKIKSGEIKSLQSEFDTLAATLRQLDNQKGEAQKRLNDLKAQVDKLRQQASDQESTLHVQEDELNSKRQEIECLKLEEHNLEAQQEEYKNHLNCLSKKLQNIQLHISQTKASRTQLEEQQRQLLNAITQYESAFAVGDISVIPDSLLLFKAKLEKHIYTQTFADITNGQNLDLNSDNKQYLFNNNDDDKNSFKTSIGDEENHRQYDPFKEDPFKEDPQIHKENIKDPFGEDPFAALHAPIRSESPSPVLPQKKNKQPPPRPAPPRPTQGLQTLRSSTPLVTPNIGSADPFTDNNIPSNTTSSDGFDFADFTKFDS